MASHPNESSDQSPNDFLSLLNLKDKENLGLELRSFVLRHASHHRPIAVVTSGGTAADLEVNSVRCLDNFSTGLRGAISVEEFLRRGYAVIHLWRVGSASPYARLLSQSIGCQANHGLSFASIGKLFVGDVEEEAEDQLVQSVMDAQSDPWLTASGSSMAGAISSSSASATGSKKPKGSDGITLHRRILNSSRLQTALTERKTVITENRLYTMPFRSVEEYLGKLQLCTEAIKDSQSLAIMYLAAAVSDFYIPHAKKSEHKIQSQNGGISLELYPVPKVMGQIRSKWAPDAFVCSFKLETDKEILRSKAERAVQKYNCHMVIGNLLHTRHDQVWVLSPSQTDQLTTTVKDWPMQEIRKPRSSDPDALEGLIVDFVVQAHFEYISSSCEGIVGKAGTMAVVHANNELNEKRRQLDRDIFWQQAKKLSLEWAGVAVGCALSYTISSALRRRLNS